VLRHAPSIFLIFTLWGCAGIANVPDGSAVLRQDVSQKRHLQNSGSAVPVIGGCRIFPSNNRWNADVSQYPLDRKSAQYIASIQNDGSGQTHLHADFGQDPTYGIPFVVVPSTQKNVPISFAGGYPTQSDPGPYPIPPNAPIQGGRGAYGDRHVLVVQSGTCKLFEMYHAHSRNRGAAWNAAAGAIFRLDSNALRPDGWTSADAAGLPIAPGLVKCDEVQAGVIDHALRFTVNRTQNGYIHPATHFSGTGGIVPMGLRVRMKASYDISRIRGQAHVIAVAMKKYGMFVADDGYNWFFTGEGTGNRPSSCWNDNDLDQLKKVPGWAFEVVKTGPILHVSSIKRI
jgi:hypothetical protein